jgi:threonine synthase
MNFYSTNNHDLRVSLQEAVLKGLPADNGLFMPETISVLPASFWDEMDSWSFPELAFQVAHGLLGDSIAENALRSIIEKAVIFDAPLVSLDEQTQVLELFHGPTLAFKDFGARFMAHLMSYFVKDSGQELTILVATSGDTGGAVASGFLQTPGIRVVILYPRGKVSELQEKQLTTLGHNIVALEIDGTFDDCQALVKQAFLDDELQTNLRLTSANSINIARLIPQMFYYFRAWQQLKDRDRETLFVVPSGNFGNLTAGLMAWKMGLPVRRFVAATNVNDVVPQYLREGVFQPRPSIRTISNAMDVGNPSNFVRMLDLFGQDWSSMKQVLKGFSFDDEATRSAIRKLHDTYEYLIDPHGAVGFLAWDEYRRHNPQSQGIILETAHPAKFIDVMESLFAQEVMIPERLARLLPRKKEALAMAFDFENFKDWLLSFGVS